jgi:hypothetical protein
MSKHAGFRRVFMAGDGSTFVDESPVFGAEMPPVFGEYDEWGEEYEMGFYEADEYGRGPQGRGPAGGNFQMPANIQQRGRRMAQGAPAQAAAASSSKKWQKTVLTGSVNATAAAAYTITIRPQFDFVAQDFTMDGSVAATTVTAISFGDHIVFQNAVGVPITTFAVAGFLRGIVKGAKIRGGLDITVQGVTGGAGTPAAQATFVGLKPQTTCD